jgi:L-ectoine synthase
VIIRRLTELDGTEREVNAPTWVSRRLLLAKDRMGFSLHDTVLHAGTVTEMRYDHHLEAVYCIEGQAELVDLEAGTSHKIEPGTMYALDRHDPHVLRAITDFRCVCVFNPPVTGQEVHDENGVYPLLTHEDTEETER